MPPHRITRRSLLAASGLVAVAGCTGSRTPVVAAPPSGSFLITDVRVFDGVDITGANSVAVADGLISAVGASLPNPANLPVYAARGATLLPGLIDAHVHIHTDEARRDATRFGVTTMLDMFSVGGSGWAAERVNSGPTSAADVWSAGTLVTAPGGHGTQYGTEIPTLAPGDDAAAFVKARIRAGSDFIKMVIDDGSAFRFTRPTLTTGQAKAVVTAAHAHKVLAVAHVQSVREAGIAVAAGADGLVHIPSDRVMTAAEAAALARTGMSVVATLSVVGSIVCSAHARKLREDPRVGQRLTPEQNTQLDEKFPIPCRNADLANAQANVAALRRAGVPVLAGTDAPNPGTTFGASLLAELSMLAEAGMTPSDALRAATSEPAEAYRLADRGRIVAGRRADLVLVDGDPTARIDDLRATRAVWKNGSAVRL